MNVMEVLTKLVVGTGKAGDHLLSRKASGLLVASLAFACGAFVVYAMKPAPRARPAAPPPVVKAPPCGTAAPPAPVVAAPSDDDEEEEYGTRELQEWKNRHSGARLPLDYDSLPKWSKLSESKVVVLPSGRSLAAAGDMLYMLDARRRVVWRHATAGVIDFVHVEATGVVCGTAYDNNMFILDAATGRVLFSDSRNGRAGFGAVLKYGDDVCLVAEALGGYNADYRGGEPMSDGVTAWRGSRMLWQASVPPDAELQVVGPKIYAVTRTKTRILVKEVKPPKGER